MSSARLLPRLIRRLTGPALIAVAFATQPPQSIHGQQPRAEVPVISPANETPALWFVELNERSASDGGSVNTARAEKAAFRAPTRQARLAFDESYVEVSG